MRKILIIEDSGILRELLKEALSANGYDVRAAENGRSGIATFRKFAPDLVLLDRDLPDAKGSDVLDWIQRDSPAARVVILTGHDDAPGERKYRAMGVKAFLSKRLGLNALLSSIKHALAAH